MSAMASEPDQGTIEIQIDGVFKALVTPDWLCSVVRATLRAERSDEPGVTVVVTDDQTLQELNRTYRGVDRPTDVLAFGGDTPGFVNAPEAGNYLGDVIISCPRAQAQAEAAGHPLEAELALLVIHGVLHLLGYDHADPSEKAAMWERQSEVLADLGLAYVQPSDDQA